MPHNDQPRNLREHLLADGMSLPRIAVKLRNWASKRDDVDKLVLGHNGGNYTLAIQLKCDSLQIVGEAECELYEKLPFQPGTQLMIHTVGPDYADAEMFNRSDNYVICDNRTPASGRGG